MVSRIWKRIAFPRLKNIDIDDHVNSSCSSDSNDFVRVLSNSSRDQDLGF